MPEIATHHFFGIRVLEKLPQEIREEINPDLYRIGVRGPDPLGVARFWWLPAWKRLHGRSSLMHNRFSGQFFRCLAQETREQTGELQRQLFSYECGFLTHYFLDSICHPYVIYRTGLGKGFAGNHRSMEHALDRLALERNSMKLRDNPISKQILQKKGLPETMKRPIDAVYAEAFGWDDAWRQINHALKDEMRFARFTEHFDGILPRFERNGTLASLSYAEKAYISADVENEQHQEWRNPYEPAMHSNRSFAELTDLAEERVLQAVRDLYTYIRDRVPYPASIGDCSYESGLKTTDPRNQQDPVFEILQR